MGYMVYFRKGISGVYSELIGEISSYADLDYTITLGLIEGETYYFKGKAQNRWGFSEEWSDEVGVLVATVPGQASGLVTQIVTASGNILAGWVAPHYNGTPIIGYRVEIKASNQSWQHVPECPLTSLTLSCEITMTNLQSAPFNLPFLSPIPIRVTAENKLGYGLPSDPNSAITVKQKPAKMSQVFEGASTQET